MIYDGLQDCVICKIVNTDVIMVALYIPPSNSIYFSESYFTNLELIYNKFKSYQLFIMGDLNCRTSTPEYNSNLMYTDNPDSTTNANGIRLVNWLKEKKNIFIVNGCITNGKILMQFHFFSP